MRVMLIRILVGTEKWAGVQESGKNITARVNGIARVSHVSRMKLPWRLKRMQRQSLAKADQRSGSRGQRARGQGQKAGMMR